MAEKEEKIYVYRFTDDDGICPLEEICTKFPRGCGNCKEIPTRTEIIERMAKALFNFQYDGGLSFENAYDGAKKEFRLFAAAALNALLEEEK